jgi:argininosuccinate synthase
VGADAVCHGATGKGNDQVRFELGYYGLKPDIKVISPWREWDLNSRTKLCAYAEANGIPVPASKKSEPPFSMDANLLHVSYEGNALEDPWDEYPEDMFTRSISPEEAPDTPTVVEIEFQKGDPVAIDGVAMSPATILAKLNELGGANGIGRKDIVESRFVGMKSRGVYETPGGTILLEAHRGMESITLDRGEMHLKDEMMPRYAEIVYNGLWWSPEREAIQALVDQTQTHCTGKVKVKLYKGSVQVVGRQSPYSLYNQEIVTFEEDSVYDQADAGGFIKIQALRLRTLATSRGSKLN